MFGVIGGIAAVVLGLRILLISVVALWSLKADKAGRSHALALIRALGATRRQRDAQRCAPEDDGPAEIGRTAR